MQLLIILALLLYGGKSNAQNILEEVKPVLQTIGGDEMKQALKSAEEISSVLSAVQGLAAGGRNTQNCAEPQKSTRSGFPLAPIMEIADRDITYSLSQYISQD